MGWNHAEGSQCTDITPYTHKANGSSFMGCLRIHGPMLEWLASRRHPIWFQRRSVHITHAHVYGRFLLAVVFILLIMRYYLLSSPTTTKSLVNEACLMTHRNSLVEYVFRQIQCLSNYLALGWRSTCTLSRSRQCRYSQELNHQCEFLHWDQNLE